MFKTTVFSLLLFTTTLVQALTISNTCVLHWDYPAGQEDSIDGFTLYDNGFALMDVAVTERSISCSAAGLWPGNHSVYVTAYNAVGESTGSNVVDFVIADSVPVAPISLNIADLTAGITIFTNETPAQENATDNRPYELGTQFSVNANGHIASILFWKAPSETGVHVGRIWGPDGSELASVTFVGESTSGWQEALLDIPVPVYAGNTYIVSVTTSSHWATTPDGLASPVTNGNISALGGLYNVIQGSLPGTATKYNYFRDVVFIQQ